MIYVAGIVHNILMKHHARAYVYIYLHYIIICTLYNDDLSTTTTTTIRDNNFRGENFGIYIIRFYIIRFVYYKQYVRGGWGTYMIIESSSSTLNESQLVSRGLGI